MPSWIRATPYKWTINVNEPWWRSSGVYWLLGLVLLILVAINAYFYLRNDRMFARRAAQERPLLKNIRHFAERCTMRGSELLEPSIDGLTRSTDAMIVTRCRNSPLSLSR